MSYLTVKGIKTYYEDLGHGKNSVVLLHGWGQNSEMMKAIALFLAPKMRVINLDFPGFGKSCEPEVAYSVSDYSTHLRELLVLLKVDKPLIVAHSFGCRVALHYALKWEVKKMVLTGAAGLKDKHHLDYCLKTYTYKLAKKFLQFKPLRPLLKQVQNKVGSSDYKNTSGVMRSTFVKVVNDDVKPFLSKINVETLLVFGDKDLATPLQKGKMMEKLMPQATLVIFENDDHYAYFHQAYRFNRVLEAFFNDELN